MPLETYRLEVRESETGEGIDVDLYGDDDLIEASARASYENFDLEPQKDRTSPLLEREVTADVTTTDVQFERDGSGFSVRVLGDREELLVERIEDDEWDLERA